MKTKLTYLLILAIGLTFLIGCQTKVQEPQPQHTEFSRQFVSENSELHTPIYGVEVWSWNDSRMNLRAWFEYCKQYNLKLIRWALFGSWIEPAYLIPIYKDKVFWRYNPEYLARLQQVFDLSKEYGIVSLFITLERCGWHDAFDPGESEWYPSGSQFHPSNIANSPFEPANNNAFPPNFIDMSDPQIYQFWIQIGLLMNYINSNPLVYFEDGNELDPLYDWNPTATTSFVELMNAFSQKPLIGSSFGQFSKDNTALTFFHTIDGASPDLDPTGFRGYSTDGSPYKNCQFADVRNMVLERDPSAFAILFLYEDANGYPVINPTQEMKDFAEGLQ